MAVAPAVASSILVAVVVVEVVDVVERVVVVVCHDV